MASTAERITYLQTLIANLDVNNRVLLERYTAELAFLQGIQSGTPVNGGVLIDTTTLSQENTQQAVLTALNSVLTRLDSDIPVTGIAGGSGGSLDSTTLAKEVTLQSLLSVFDNPIDTTASLSIDSTGLATASKQDSIISAIQNQAVSVDITGLATDSGQATANTTLSSIDTKLGGPLQIDDSTPIATTASIDATGLATEAKQDSIISAIQNQTVSVDTTGLATDTGQSTANTSLASIDTKLGNPLLIDDSTPIATTASIDTTGLATDTNQVTTNSSLANIDTKLAGTLTVDTQLTGLSTEAKQDSIISALSAPLEVEYPATALGQKAPETSLSVVMATGTQLEVTGTLDTNPTTKTPNSGTVTIGTTAVQLPNIPAQSAILSWSSSNSGKIYIGTTSGVTSANAGYELDTNLRSLPVELNNLNEYYAIGSAAGQVLRWLSS